MSEDLGLPTWNEYLKPFESFLIKLQKQQFKLNIIVLHLNKQPPI